MFASVDGRQAGPVVFSEWQADTAPAATDTVQGPMSPTPIVFQQAQTGLPPAGQNDSRAAASSAALAAVNQLPKGYLDFAGISAGNGTMSGWAFDPDSPSTSINVHIYIDGTFFGGFAANLSRPDVNAFFGITGNHGFNISAPLAAALLTGSHTVTIYALDTAWGTNPPITRTPYFYSFAPALSGIQPAMRLYNPTTKQHYYTSSGAEKSFVLGQGYQDEGETGFFGPSTSSKGTMVAAYRVHNLASGQSLLTGATEASNLVAAGWVNEGRVGHVMATNAARTLPVYRLYNGTTGDHLFTMGPGERDYATAAQGYTYEGVAGYVGYSNGVGAGNGTATAFISLDGKPPKPAGNTVGQSPDKFWAYAKIPTLIADGDGKTRYSIFLKPNPTASDAGSIYVNGVAYALHPLGAFTPTGDFSTAAHIYYSDPARPFQVSFNCIPVGYGCLEETFFYHFKDTVTGQVTKSFVDFGASGILICAPDATNGCPAANPGPHINAYAIPEGNGHVGLAMSQAFTTENPTDWSNTPPALFKDTISSRTTLGVATTGDFYGTFFLYYPGHPEWGGYVFVDPPLLAYLSSILKTASGITNLIVVTTGTACVFAPASPLCFPFEAALTTNLYFGGHRLSPTSPTKRSTAPVRPSSRAPSCNTSTWWARILATPIRSSAPASTLRYTWAGSSRELPSAYFRRRIWTATSKEDSGRAAEPHAPLFADAFDARVCRRFVGR